MADDTIAAIATAAGRGGIGIVKISGERSIPIAAAIFLPASEGTGKTPSNRQDIACRMQRFPHRLLYGHVYDTQKDCILDEVLMSVMPAPRSYTREDVVEINAHGGPVALQAILKLVIANGARLAEPGEFTRRAFLNGRIDLTQAEAVVDLINARTERSLQAAAAQMSGQLQANVGAVRNAVIELLTGLEAAIDFPDAVDDFPDTQSLVAVVQRDIVRPIKRLIRNYDEAHILRDGLHLAVVGKPNVGKSSLLNRMVQKERAIVTEVAGTTRDVVSETINLRGVPVTLSDTAGLQNSSDPVEIIGIRKAMEQVECCDLVLFLVEAHLPLSAEDLSIYTQIRHRPHIIVMNKIDLVAGQLTEELLPASLREHPSTAISALHGNGLEALKDMILGLATGERPIDLSASVIPNIRHKQLLDAGLSAAEELCSGLKNAVGAEILTINASETLNFLEEILGITVKADIIERIFEQFCIGK